MFPEEYVTAEWRVGRTVGRTIYAMRGGAPNDTDPLIGMMDTPQLAQRAVKDHNKLLEQTREESIGGCPFCKTSWIYCALHVVHMEMVRRDARNERSDNG